MKTLLLFTCSILAATGSHAQVGVGTTTPHPGAALEVSGNKAFIVPRLSAADIAALGQPAAGMIVFNSGAREFWGYGFTGDTLISLTSLSGSSIGTQYVVAAGGSVGQTFTAPTAGTQVLKFEPRIRFSNTAVQTVVAHLRSGAGTTGAIVGSDTIVYNFPSNTETPLSFSWEPAGLALPASGVYTVTVEVPSWTSSTQFWACIGHTPGIFPNGNLVVNSTAHPAADMKCVLTLEVAGWKVLDK